MLSLLCCVLPHEINQFHVTLWRLIQSPSLPLPPFLEMEAASQVETWGRGDYTGKFRFLSEMIFVLAKRTDSQNSQLFFSVVQHSLYPLFMNALK